MAENNIKDDKKNVENDEKNVEDNVKDMKNDENQVNGVKIGDICSYSGVLSATEELVRYDVGILYDLAKIGSPVKITEIDGFYDEYGKVEINCFHFHDFVMHRASVLLYSVFHPFNSPLRTAMQKAGLLTDGVKASDIWI